MPVQSDSRVSSTHSPSGVQQLPMTLQFAGTQVARITQSPVGRQMLGHSEKGLHPAGHPKMPQSTAKIQFSLGSASPLVSVAGKALQQEGGARRKDSGS